MSKHFIAALGISCYNMCNYQLNNQEFSTNFSQEALLNILGFGHGDKATILLTDLARKRNWEDRTYQCEDILAMQRYSMEGEALPSEGDKKEGLQSILQRNFKGLRENDVTIPEGKSEEEIWETFETVYDQIEENDTIYFDITNGFRSLPMLAMTILSYSKMLKNTEIKGIYYGALEAKDKKTGIVPIFDLTACNDILNWTIAANNFVKYGNSNLIGELCRKSSDSAFVKSWKRKLDKAVNLTNCIEASRGMEQDAISNKSNSIKKAYNDFKNSPLEVKQSASVEKIVLPLYEKIEEKTAIFDKKSNFEIGMATVEWSIENGMIQQGFTALLETMKTFLCNQYGIDEYEYEARDVAVAGTLNVVRLCNTAMKDQVTSKTLRMSTLKENKGYQKLMRSFDKNKRISIYKGKAEQLAYEVPQVMAILYGKISNYRNDMNHFGFKKQPMSHDILHKKLKACYKEFVEVVKNYQAEKLK